FRSSSWCFLWCSTRCFSFFFFQAEDGIRDWSVTGVQTCALPIFTPLGSFSRPAWVGAALRRGRRGREKEPSGVTDRRALAFLPRSEERRVGKEGRSRWWPCG